MNAFIRNTACNHVIAVDANDRNVCCDKPRCEEAGRRSLCLEHWQELAAKRKKRIGPRGAGDAS
jgi:hypothetical protein